MGSEGDGEAEPPESVEASLASEPLSARPAFPTPPALRLLSAKRLAGILRKQTPARHLTLCRAGEPCETGATWNGDAPASTPATEPAGPRACE